MLATMYSLCFSPSNRHSALLKDVYQIKCASFTHYIGDSDMILKQLLLNQIHYQIIY